MRNDARRRSLEHAARSGDAEAACALLIHRHQEGELEEVRLRLAAHLGDPMALRAAAELWDVVPRRQNLPTRVRWIGTPDTEAWPRALDWRPLVKPTCIHVALATCEHATPAWIEEGADEEDLALVSEIGALSLEWLHDPSTRIEDRIVERLMSVGLGGVAGEVALELGSIVVSPSAAARTGKEREAGRSTARIVEAATRALVSQLDEGPRKAKARAEASLQRAILDTTVPWLLDGSARRFPLPG